MHRWISALFIDPFIYALAYEWQAEKLVREKKHVSMSCAYVQSTLRSQSLALGFVIHTLCFFFLITVRLTSLQSFSKLPPQQAVRFIQRWRRSRWPGFAQLIQLFENLIALSLYSFLENHEFDRE